VTAANQGAALFESFVHDVGLEEGHYPLFLGERATSGGSQCRSQRLPCRRLDRDGQGPLTLIQATMARHAAMVTAMIYDTLKLAEQLETEAGFDAPRARAMARILAENAGGNLATREDILVAKGELQAEIQHLSAGLRDEIQRVSTGLGGEIQAVNTSLRNEIQRVSTGLGGEIHAVNTSLRDEIQRVSTGLREEIQGLRGDVRVLYWITGTTFAGVAGLLSIAIAMALHVMHLG
jgi:hypothetical protein